MTASSELKHRLINEFSAWLEAYDKYCPFTRYGQLEYHCTTIKKRRRLVSARDAIEDAGFQKRLYQTLQAWGIGTRGSKLRPLQEFIKCLQAKKEEIVSLEKLSIDECSLDVPRVASKIASLIQSLDIVENKARIVAGSKALHHLLPELIVPIDRAYTQLFFGWPTHRVQYEGEECFIEAFRSFVDIARSIDLAKYVGDGWYTSKTKVIDNAIVGLLCWAKQQVKDQFR